MKCSQIKLVQLLNGQLSSPEIEELLDHMDGCSSCSEGFRNLLDVRVLSPELRAELRPEDFTARSRSSAWRSHIPSLAAAAILILALGGLFVIRTLVAPGPGPAPVSGPAARPAPGLLPLETAAYEYVAPIYRGPSSQPDSERESLLARYDEGKYAEFLSAGKPFALSHPTDERFLFFMGVAAYLTNRNAEAETYLSAAKQVASSPRPETDWYLANTLLKLDRFSEAHPLLEFLSTLDHPYARRARAILAALPPASPTPGR